MLNDASMVGSDPGRVGADMNIIGRKVKTYAMGLAIVLLLALNPGGGAWADPQMIKQGEESFKINLGGIVNRNDSDLRIDGSSGQSREINLEDEGLEEDSAGLLGEVTWRFAAKHRLGLQVFALERSGSKTTTEDLQLGDEVIPAGTLLSAESKTQFLIVNYQYSFIKNDRLELAGLVGFYGARFKFIFDAASPETHVDKSTDVPLPVIGARLDYFVTPRWTASLFGEGMKLKVGDVDGPVFYAGVSTEYMLTRHFGLGIGYSLADLQLDVEKDDFRGSIGWRMNSLLGYAQLRF
jgi:hypothetical protein